MLQIVLDKPVETYVPGENVSGAVVMTNPGENMSTSIRLKFVGKAVVNWIESVHSGTKTFVDKYFTDVEFYFKEEETLLQNAEKGKPVQGSEGLKFPFTYQLPLDLPSSFRRITGHVTYTIQATATHLSSKKDITANFVFIVNGKLNLSHEEVSNLNKPVQIGDTKKLGLFHGSGNIGFTFKLEKRLFAPGEFIGFSANFENHSKKKIQPEIKLVRVMEFRAKGKMKTDTREIVNLTGPKVLPGREEVWVGRDVLKIPEDLLPTGLGGPCRIIKLRHILNIQMGVLSQDVPITIGEMGEAEVKFSPPPSYEAAMKE